MHNPTVKEKIVKGAEELFMKYGVRSISMDDIAHRLTVSKKTLYQYFANKDELVSMVSKNHLKHKKLKYNTILSGSSNSVEELYKINHYLSGEIEEMHPSLLFDIEKFYPKAFSAFSSFRNNFVHKSIVRNLKQGIEEGYFRPEIQVDVIATIRLINIQAGFNEQLFPKTKFNLALVQRQLFEFFVFGICTEKGKKLYMKYKKTLVNN